MGDMLFPRLFSIHRQQVPLAWQIPSANAGQLPDTFVVITIHFHAWDDYISETKINFN